VRISLDHEQVSRVYGYALEPEVHEGIELSLAVPKTGARQNVEGRIAENFSEHALARLPVKLALQVWDGAGQTSDISLSTGVLPGRQFFDPLAAALIDIRGELLWNRKNAPRAADILRAVSHAPTGAFTHGEPLRLRLRSLAGLLETGAPAISDPVRNEAAQALWNIAVELEDGDLAEALARLRRAQERLAQAMKDGASAEDIARLMQELKDASEAYIRQLAEQQGEDESNETQGQNGSDVELSGDQLQEMMDRIQELMEQGRMSEAQRLLDALNEFLENMQVREGAGQGGSSSDAPREQLEQSLRDQQDLSDDTFRKLQEQQSGRGEQGQDLEQRQQDLREGLSGDEEGGAAAGAMREAEDALSDENFSGALSAQAQALEALREGVRKLSEANEPSSASAGDEQNGQGQDPLGRSQGAQNGGVADEGAQLDGGDAPYNRAQDLSQDLRRRHAEQDRDIQEREFLERLLKAF
jgi:hypothetical protein